MQAPEPIVLTTKDGVPIAGAIHDADQPKAAVLLLHMMPATKESWSAFSSALSGLGVASLAIDLRGHGASTAGPSGTLDYRTFSDAQHQAARLDVEAALALLRSRYPGVPLRVAGASIGANLAIRAMAEHPDVARCLALSPGLVYHGVETDDAVGRLRAGQRLLLAVSEEDTYASESVSRLAASASCPVEREELRGAGHGTRMFEADPGFMRRAASWIASV